MGRRRIHPKQPSRPGTQRGWQDFMVLNDPEGDYNPGAIIHSTHMKSTLGFQGLNAGTVLQQRGRRYEVVSERGVLSLKKVSSKHEVKNHKRC